MIYVLDDAYVNHVKQQIYEACRGAMSDMPKFQRVVSIVSPSRAGSSIFKHALCLHPDLCSLAGEEEPYYKLAKNGYPWHKSDEFHEVNGHGLIRNLMGFELRNLHQFAFRQILHSTMIEEPPFVDPIECRLTDTLVLKTPQNVYRRGVLEQLFPDSEIIYVQLLRNKYATVNGLIDGWLSNDFKARPIQGKWWWKFDMPPNWAETPLISRCINQWRMAEMFLRRDFRDAKACLTFEEFEEDWLTVTKYVWNCLGLAPFDPVNHNLPILMATDNPSKNRWRNKRPWLEDIDFDAH